MIATEQVPGITPVVCFQDMPLRAIVENIRYEKYLREEKGMPKKRYSPFGIRIEKRYAFRLGARPVVYEKNSDYKDVLTPDNYWRYVAMDYESKGQYADWAHEREWRSKDDFHFDYTFIAVALPTDRYYRKFIEDCIKRERMDILSSIMAIDVLMNDLL